MAENYFGITDIGRQRTNNEDTFIALRTLNEEFIAACVIDGVGGYTGGEVAAQIAQNAILDALKEPIDDAVQMMKQAFTIANNKISKERNVNRDNDQMACVITMAMADVANNKFYYAHVGDTRLYLLRDNTLVKITKDQSFVGFLEDSGRLSEDEAMHHPKRNEINKALGFDTIVEHDGYIETGDSPFLPGDTLLLCSDGLSDMISANTITSILNENKSLSQKAYALVDAANDAGGQDNITVVLVHNDKEPVKQEVTKPVISKKNEEPETVEPSTPVEDAPTPIEIKKEKRGNTILMLSFFCAVLLGAVGWLLYKDYKSREDARKNKQVELAIKKRNKQEQALLDSITNVAATKSFSLSAAESVLITDAVMIMNDSLYINGNGVTLKSDSAYTGPAIILSSSCRYILLDSLTLENFDVAVLVQNKGLHLRDVQFKNCRVGVQYQFLFPVNKFITGSSRFNISHRFITEVIF